MVIADYFPVPYSRSKQVMADIKKDFISLKMVFNVKMTEVVQKSWSSIRGGLSCQVNHGRLKEVVSHVKSPW